LSQNGSKTEKASQHKKQEERKKGNIFQSKDLVTAASLLAMVYLFKWGGGLLLSRLRDGIASACATAAATEELSAREAAGILTKFSMDAAYLIVPIAGAVAVLGVVFVGVQTRFLFTPSLLAPKLSRISPLTGLKNLFSRRTLVELLKSIVKVVIISVILFTDARSALPTVTLTPLVEPLSSIQWLGAAVFNITVRISVAMVIFAAFDFIYQWWDHEKRLMMTKEEVKEENKRLEGDPNIKGRIRSIQRRLAMSRMMQKVPTADVVIKNPTHYAVALRYKPPKDASPVVVAKGVDLTALRIIRIAEENGVHVTENKPLARGLYEAVDLDRPIPEKFYKPVADIIAFIYQLKKRRAK
jgi:flagellar biosynthetic protein FlhB